MGQILLQRSIAGAARRRGGGASPLLTDLVDWWENASQTGQHAGLALTNMNTRSSVIAGPDGLNAWQITTASTLSRAGTQDVGANFTYAVVLRESSLAFRSLINGLYSLETWNTGALLLRLYGGSNLFTATRTVTNWASVVLSKSGSSATLYLNGIAHATTGWTDTGTENPIVLQSSGMDISKFIRASRAWTQADVDEFHNSGAFIRYSDL